MTATPKFSAYPFDRIPRVSREQARVESVVARWLSARGQGTRLAKLVGDPVRAQVVPSNTSFDPYAAICIVKVHGASIECRGSSLAVRAIAQRLLGGPAELPAPRPLTIAEESIWCLVVATALEDLGVEGLVWPVGVGVGVSGAPTGATSSRPASSTPAGSSAAPSRATSSPPGSSTPAGSSAAPPGATSSPRGSSSSSSAALPGATPAPGSSSSPASLIAGAGSALARGPADASIAGAGSLTPTPTLTPTTAGTRSPTPLALDITLGEIALAVELRVPTDLELRAPPATSIPAWADRATLDIPIIVGRCAIARTALDRLAVRSLITLEAPPGGAELEILGGTLGLRAAPKALVAEVVTDYLPRDMTLPDAAHVELTVALGTTQLSLRQVLELSIGQIVSLGRPLAGPFELRAAGRVVGRGELVDVDGELAVRIVSLGDQE